MDLQDRHMPLDLLDWVLQLNYMELAAVEEVRNRPAVVAVDNLDFVVVDTPAAEDES